MKAKFKGKLTITPPKIQKADFLTGDFGKEFLKEYEYIVKRSYNNNQFLTILRYSDGVVKGSNPFAVVLANQILRQERLKTATQAELEGILECETLELRGHVVYTNLVLRSNEAPNSYLAQYSMKQVKARNPEQEFPVMIPLIGLELVNDSDSNYSLAFELTEDAEIIYTPILNKQGRFTSRDIDKKTGLPRRTRKKGNRTLYIINSGLSGLSLDWDLNLDSSSCLAYSGSDGRIVVVRD